ncbi:permease C29B12,14c [Ceratobasidium sp. AG-Ba]|nr:permease C29B12,14c [Ceratobasidium sp. AG-Ba]
MDAAGSEDARSVANGPAQGNLSESTPLVSSAAQWRVYANDRSAKARLQPFLNKAFARQKYQYRLNDQGKMIKYGINFIILLQVTVGAVITIVAVLEPSEQTRLATAGLGALGTITAAILARAKGTNQPELAETHSRDLERFIGQCELFIGDAGSATGSDIDAQVMEFARQFDAIEDRAAQAYRGRETQTAAAPPV